MEQCQYQIDSSCVGDNMKKLLLTYARRGSFSCAFDNPRTKERAVVVLVDGIETVAFEGERQEIDLVLQQHSNARPKDEWGKINAALFFEIVETETETAPVLEAEPVKKGRAKDEPVPVI